MAGSLKVILWFIVIFGCNFDPAVLVVEGGGGSCFGFGFEILVARLEYVEEQMAKQQQEIAKLNQDITQSLEENLSKHLKSLEEVLMNKLSQLELGNSAHIEGMKREIAKMVENQDRLEKNLDDKFAQQNQHFEQRLGNSEKAILNRVGQLTEANNLNIEKLNNSVLLHFNGLKKSFDSKFSNFEQTHEKSQKDLTMNYQNYLNKTIQGVIVPQLKQLSNEILQLQSDNKNGFDNTKVQIRKHNDEQGKISTMLVSMKETISNNISNQSVVATLSMQSCSDARIKNSGRYWIQPFIGEEPFEVYCEHEKFGGGWLVIQNRFDGSVDFFRGWEDYKNGFGDLTGEFFMGLQIIHRLTTTKKHLLMVEVESFDGKYGYARYDNFKLGSENELFELKEIGSYSGTAGDSMPHYKGRKFSTKDKDHDAWSSGNCASNQKGAWWYEYCAVSNLNGPYVKEGGYQFNYWDTLNNKREGLKMTRMMVKEA